MTVLTNPLINDVGSVKSTKGATVEKEKISWPLVVLLSIVTVTLTTAVVLLSFNGKPTEAVIGAILAILGAAGIMQHGTAKQIEKQTNGNTSQLLEMQREDRAMIRELALRLSPPKEVDRDPES